MKISPQNDLARFRHLRDAIAKTIELTAGFTQVQFQSDELRVLAVTRLLEIAGEAASKITPERQRTYDDVPWGMLIGMRNHLIHGYFSVDEDIIWDTITHNLPPLLVRIEEVIAELERSEPSSST